MYIYTSILMIMWNNNNYYCPTLKREGERTERGRERDRERGREREGGGVSKIPY